MAKVKERTICLTSEEVRLSMEGGKDMLRRPLKPQPVVYPGQNWCLVWKNDEHFFRHTFAEWANEHGPLGRVGDRLLVREAWGLPHYDTDEYGECWGVDDWEGPTPKSKPPFHRPVYAADGRYSGESREDRGFRWRSPATMPRWACRYAIEITESKVEQLASISESDAAAEGVRCEHGYSYCTRCRVTPAMLFSRLWDSARGKRYPWASNPWVQAIRYKLVELSKE